MFSYIHRYHAGGFADVHKHLVLIALLEALHKKSTPFGVLDTHAGEGFYDLQCEESQKLGEYKQGIAPLQALTNPPPLVSALLALVAGSIYPGSPAIIAHYLREQDNAIAVEGHPQAF